MRAAVLLTLVLPWLAACAGGDRPGPAPRSLAVGEDPMDALAGGWTGPDGRAITVRHDGDGAWLELEVAASDWTVLPRSGLMTTAMPFEGVGTPEVRLRGDPRLVGLASLSGPKVRQRKEKALDPGEYHPFHDELYLRLPEGAEPPRRTWLGLQVDVTARGADGELRVRGRRFSGTGLAVWPGLAVEREVTLARPARLRVATCSERLLAGGPPDAAHAFTVRVDGETVLEHEQALAAGGAVAWHAVDVPAGRRRITLEVAGPLAHTAFLVPTLGPVDVPAYDAAGRARSVVLFVADTFRADNMALYGGDPSVTPNLDALADESLRLLRAWSVGTYTLPGHASMFTGLFPRQTTADAFSVTLPDDATTIAEHLRAHGYRTGAVTDGGVVSMRFGVHQGFEWFDEAHRTFTSTVERARAFLEADDGRPVFLFVQTYRVHSPYRADERGVPFSEAAHEDFTDFHAVSATANELAALETRTPAQERELGARLDELRAMYRAGARDLDRGFAGFLAMLDALGLEDGGALLFTSDHGEAFLEHGELYHRGKVFEEQIRIPLLVRAPGLAPRAETRAASLVDVPRTIADLAGVPPAPGWLGESLLSLSRDRAVFAFECDWRSDRSTVAVVEGPRKLIGIESISRRALVEPWRAYDLSDDPGERRDLAGERAWPRALFERARPVVRPLLAPAFGEQAAALGEDKTKELRALGYLGDDG